MDSIMTLKEVRIWLEEKGLNHSIEIDDRYDNGNYILDITIKVVDDDGEYGYHIVDESVAPVVGYISFNTFEETYKCKDMLWVFFNNGEKEYGGEGDITLEALTEIYDELTNF